MNLSDSDASDQSIGNDATSAVVCSAVCISVKAIADSDRSRGNDRSSQSAPVPRLSKSGACVY